MEATGSLKLALLDQSQMPRTHPWPGPAEKFSRVSICTFSPAERQPSTRICAVGTWAV
jgi:hypothetical protein